MKYVKPEIVVLASANVAIQGSKSTTFNFDNALNQIGYVTVAAYEADE